jgi:hypothetical protein
MQAPYRLLVLQTVLVDRRAGYLRCSGPWYAAELTQRYVGQVTFQLLHGSDQRRFDLIFG